MASMIARKRWEWREQAIASLNVQAEAMSKPSKGTNKPAVDGGILFRKNSGGINYGPPPLDVFAKMGF